MKKVLFSLMAIALVVGLVGAGAVAQFFDTEISEGNTFTAGTLDLKVWDPQLPGGPGAWVDDSDVPNINTYWDEMVNLLKPGDSGTITIPIRNAGSIDGTAKIQFTSLVDDPGDTPEPEAALGTDNGELSENLDIVITYKGIEVAKNTLYTLANGPITLGDLLHGAEEDVIIDISIDSSVENEIQGDTCTVDVVFGLDQK